MFISCWSFLIFSLWWTLLIFFLPNWKYIRKLFLTIGSLTWLYLKSVGIYFISEILAFSQWIDQHFELVFQLAWLLGFITDSHFSYDNFIIIYLKYITEYNFQSYIIRIYALHFTPPSTIAQVNLLLLALIKLSSHRRIDLLWRIFVQISSFTFSQVPWELLKYGQVLSLLLYCEDHSSKDRWNQSKWFIDYFCFFIVLIFWMSDTSSVKCLQISAILLQNICALNDHISKSVEFEISLWNVQSQNIE